MQDINIQRRNLDIDRGILALLTKGPCTALDIQRSLCIYNKGQINNSLYERLAPSNRVFRLGQDKNMNPIWSCVPVAQEMSIAYSPPVSYSPPLQELTQMSLVTRTSSQSAKVIVAVDLGNVHDCLPHCENFIDQGYVDYVMAFADYQFSGFGVKPPLNKPSIRVVQAEDQHKNSADLLLIWDCQAMLIEYGRDYTMKFVIATKDEGFRSLKTLVEKEGKHRVVFVKDLEQLCNEIGAICPKKTQNRVRHNTNIVPPW